MLPFGRPPLAICTDKGKPNTNVAAAPSASTTPMQHCNTTTVERKSSAAIRAPRLTVEAMAASDADASVKQGRDRSERDKEMARSEWAN